MLGRTGTYTLAKGIALSQVRESHEHHPDSRSVSVCPMPKAGIGHGGNDVSPEPFTASEMVLDDLLDGNFSKRRINA